MMPDRSGFSSFFALPARQYTNPNVIFMDLQSHPIFNRCIFFTPDYLIDASSLHPIALKTHLLLHCYQTFYSLITDSNFVSLVTNSLNPYNVDIDVVVLEYHSLTRDTMKTMNPFR